MPYKDPEKQKAYLRKYRKKEDKKWHAAKYHRDYMLYWRCFTYDLINWTFKRWQLAPLSTRVKLILKYRKLANKRKGIRKETII